METPRPCSSLTLGKRTFPNSLIQGPLAGYSCWPMRVLAQQYSPPAFCYTEMLSAKTLANTPLQNIQPRFRIKDPREGALCVQLSGTHPEELAKAAERAIEFGADLIDLNCGCPVTKIRQKGAGSKLLEDPILLRKLVSALKSANGEEIPLSIKIRVDGDSPHRYSLNAALAAEEAGIDFITIHGRHWSESYDTPCRLDQIAEISAELSIPVIANGDAHDTASTLHLLKETGANGVMIARAALGQPWLFNQINTEIRGEKFTPPTQAKIGELFLEHLDGLISLEGEKIAVLQARKLIKYYARFLSSAQKDTLINKANVAEIRADMGHLVRDFFVCEL